MGKSPLNKHKRRSKYALPLAGIFLILAAVGLVSVAGVCIRLTNQLMDNTRQKTMFEDYLLPVVMFDPVEFDSPEYADPLFLLQSSLWGTLLENPDKYTFDESAMLVVPASDLDVYAAKLYGDVVKLTHRTIEDFDFAYPYDEETQTYGVPVLSQTSQYTPRVDKIERKGNIYTLTVGYIPPGTLWEAAVGGAKYEPEPVKHMIYTLERVKDEYHILSLESIDVWGTDTQSEVSYDIPELPTVVPEEPAEGEGSQDGASTDVSGDDENASSEESGDEEEENEDGSSEESGEEEESSSADSAQEDTSSSEESSSQSS